MSDPLPSERVDRILDVLLRLASGDFAARAEVVGSGDTLDALAGGINMLAEEIEAQVCALERGAEELRAQVSDRSRQLAEALARLSRPHAEPIAPGGPIDNRYRVIGKLGAGGMGVVYEVVRIGDGRRFALKTLHGRVGTEAMARFAREAQIAAELGHPNLVSVLDMGVTPGGILFLVMEIVDGASLESQRGRFGDTHWALPILAQIAAGLSALHERRIIHRDLKPANILLAHSGARIADFGLARLLSDTPPIDSAMLAPTLPPSSLTLTRMIFGTPGYMAPELTTGMSVVDPAADVFSFGVIACEMLTGRAPFAEPPLVSRLNGRPMSPAMPIHVDGVDAVTLVLLERCLQLVPGARPTAVELFEALRR